MGKTEKGIEYKERHKSYAKEWRTKNKEKFHNGQRHWYDKIKIETFTYYSKGTPRCNCCGETIIEFLTLDHIKGNGAEHKRLIKEEIGYKPGGNGLYYYLKKKGYPEGLQVLCANCNFSKKQNKDCAHIKYIDNTEYYI